MCGLGVAYLYARTYIRTRIHTNAPTYTHAQTYRYKCTPKHVRTHARTQAKLAGNDGDGSDTGDTEVMDRSEGKAEEEEGDEGLGARGEASTYFSTTHSLSLSLFLSLSHSLSPIPPPSVCLIHLLSINLFVLERVQPIRPDVCRQRTSLARKASFKAFTSSEK
jgi:hypothetical protein